MNLYYPHHSSWLAQRAIMNDEFACSEPLIQLYAPLDAMIPLSPILPYFHHRPPFTRLSSQAAPCGWPWVDKLWSVSITRSIALSTFSPLPPDIKLQVVYLGNSCGCGSDKRHESTIYATVGYYLTVSILYSAVGSKYGHLQTPNMKFSLPSPM